MARAQQGKMSGVFLACTCMAANCTPTFCTPPGKEVAYYLKQLRSRVPELAAKYPLPGCAAG